MLKKLSWLFLRGIGLLLCAFSAWAAQYPDECPCDLITYQYDGGVKVHAELLFMTGHMRDTDYAVRLASNNANASIKPLKAEFDFEPGFQLEVGYQFPGTAYEISLRFFSLVLGATEHTTGENIQGKFVNVFDEDLPAGLEIANPVFSAAGKIGLDIRNIEMLFGQTVQTASDHLHLKWLIGARTVTINQKFKATYKQTVAEELVEVVSATSEFSGLGPVIGAQASLNLGHGFSVTTELMTAFLMSKINSHFEDTVSHTALLDMEGKPLNHLRHQTGDYEEKIISAIDSRIGLLYTLNLQSDSQIGIEAGLQISHYFDTDFRFSSSGSDVGLAGLYLRASYLM